MITGIIIGGTLALIVGAIDYRNNGASSRNKREVVRIKPVFLIEHHLSEEGRRVEVQH